MSQPKVEEEKNKEPFVEVEDEDAKKSQVHVEDSIPFHDGNQSPLPSTSTSTSQEETVVTKYGGLLRKKPPLISMGHEHAFFDSADWELRKQGAQKSKGLLEKLRPKLEPTPHQQLGSRRSAYDPPHNGDEGNNVSGCKDDGDGNDDDGDGNDDDALEDEKRLIDNVNEKDDHGGEEEQRKNSHCKRINQ